jgi:hypothetical protein
MGILDEAIREHLDLKRRRGAEDDELKKLENEAFGPPGRPQAPGMDESVPESSNGQSAAEAAEPSVELPEAPPEEAPATEALERPRAPEAPPEPEPSPAGPVFHDLAAEEGFVGASRAGEEAEELVGPETWDEAVAEARTEVRAPDEPGVDEAPATETSEEQPGEALEPEPAEETPVSDAAASSLEDTQVHDMEAELAGEVEAELAEEEAAEAATAEGGAGEPAGDVELEEVGLELDEEDLELAEEELDKPVTDSGEEEPSGDDVLEETPDFLRDTPESDRLWFEQGQPKDFDFDDEE